MTPVASLEHFLQSAFSCLRSVALSRANLSLVQIHAGTPHDGETWGCLTMAPHKDGTLHKRGFGGRRRSTSAQVECAPIIPMNGSDFAGRIRWQCRVGAWCERVGGASSSGR